jgi:pyruvate formate lyase activating enzyme
MIRGFIETSLVDWDGNIAAVAFFDTCDFRCPFCQNWDLLLNPTAYPAIEWSCIKQTVLRKKDWVDGLVFTGGEPCTREKELRAFSRDLKESGIAVKLDTNGHHPRVLEALIKEQLVDYVAMDIKAALDREYSVAAGIPVDLKKIRRSIDILMNGAVAYEFRTTCVPGIVRQDTIEKIGTVIRGASKWALQGYVPDNAYKEEYRRALPQAYPHTMKTYVEVAKEYVGNVVLRGNIPRTDT